MGREALCRCRWGAQEADCKVLLEGSELILRLGIRRRIPLSTIAGLTVRRDKLVFDVGQDRVELRLGPEAAQRWAKAISSPPPTLARKLGISPATRVSVLGDAGSKELEAAIAQGSSASAKEADLILLCVHSPSELHQLLAGKTYTAPLWIIYPKGAGSQVNESQVRDLLCSRGFVDTKVASVSARLTALRFKQRTGI